MPDLTHRLVAPECYRVKFDGIEVKVFADADSADAWFRLHDPEGVVFEYPVIRNEAEPPPLQPT